MADQILAQETTTAQATFTPGPWAVRRHERYTTIVSASVDPIARLDEWTGISGRSFQPSRFQSEANARLIAAAPDLYEALEGLNISEDRIIGGTADSLTLRVPIVAIQKAAAALRKANGE